MPKPFPDRYLAYINSPEWRWRSWGMLTARSWTCESCGYWSRTGNVQVHHLSYARLGKELPEDLAVLCRDCHARVHHREPTMPRTLARLVGGGDGKPDMRGNRVTEIVKRAERAAWANAYEQDTYDDSEPGDI